MPNKQKNLDEIFHALSDPTRRAVLRRLSRGCGTVTALAEPFDMALPSFVQHLKVLEDSGLIYSKKKGRVRFCYIGPKALKTAERWLTKQRDIWERRLDQFDEYVLKLKNKENSE
jgi:DNA-binding transcriptional ArsR family regulator